MNLSILIGFLLVALAAGGKYNSMYQELLALKGEIYPTDPIWWKARNAAVYSEAVHTGNTTLLDAEDTTTVEVEGNKVLVATSPSISAILAFSVEDGLFKGVSAASDDGGPAFSVVPFMQDFLNISTVAEAVDLFSVFMEDQNLTGVVAATSRPSTPSSILCTAYGDAGLLVPLCALWAVSTWPKAAVAAITFGSPWLGDAKFNWTFSQLVDLYYLFPDDWSGYNDGELTDQSLEKALDIVYNDRWFSDRSDIAEGFRQVFDDATTVVVTKPDGGVNFEEDGGSGNTTDPIERGEAYDVYQTNLTIDTCLPILESSCPRVLCKTRLGAFLSAMIYWEYDPENPKVQGPVPLDKLYPESVRVKGDYDADASVIWNATEQTVYFVFRGSESDQDWTQNYKAIPRDWNFISKGLEASYDEPEVHWGFREQFEALTSNAKDSVNIYKIYEQLSGGTKAKLVWCTGQSLGGGLSTLCGAWAAQTFPDTQVLVVNEGSPRAGDDEYQPYFNTIVGRAWRVVNGKDQVAAIPPSVDFKHVEKGLWLPDTKTLLLEERPKIPFGDTNWEDHNYYFYAYYQCLIDEPTVPSWVFQMN